MMLACAKRGKGFSLVELMVVLGILAVLFSIAFPLFGEWIANIRVRNQADAIQGGLQQARAEAIRRNRYVRFQLVSAEGDGSLGASCAVTDTSNRWVVSHGDPDSACNQAQSQNIPDTNAIYFSPPILLIRGVQDIRQATIQTLMTLTAATTSGAFARGATIGAPPGEGGHALCFAPSGQLTRYDVVSRKCTATMNPGTTTIARAQINVSSTTDACAPGGPVRCMRVTVGASGETRMCDPAMPMLASRTKTAAEVALRDVRGCFCDPAVGTATSADYCPD